MDDDWQQIETYVSRRAGAEKAFAVIVERHLRLVFSAALRQANDRAAAEEITQSVFVLLARKAPELKPGGSLAAWLYHAASLKAKEHLRSEIARRQRERKAHDMATDTASADALDWDRVAPLLDAAMGELPELDREAVLMRYFQDRPLRDVGESLGVSEDAARKRVSRAVDRLRGWFAERGVAFGAGALVAALPTRTAEAVPAHLLSATLQNVAAETATATTTSALTTAMASTKLTAAAVAFVAAVIPISLGFFDPPAPAADASDPPVAVDPIAIPEPADSELMAEWKRLRSKFGPDAGSMPELFAAIKDIEDDFRRRAFRNALVAEWSLIDPDGALVFLMNGEKWMVGQLFEDWLAHDPDAAIEAMISRGPKLSATIKRHLEWIAENSPEDLAALAPFVKKGRPWDLHVQKAFALYAKQDMAAARSAAGEMDGEAAAEAIAGIAEVWAERDGEAALAWVEGIGDRRARDRAMQALLIGWAKTDPLAALERIDSAPAGGDQMSQGWTTASQVINAAAMADLDLTLQWMAENPPSNVHNNGYDGLHGVLGERFLSDVDGTLEFIRDNPAQGPLKSALHNVLLNEGFGARDEMWKWVSDQPDSKFIGELRLTLIRCAAYKQPDVAVGWIQSLPEEVSAGLDYGTFARSLLNGGNNQGRLDGLLERVGDSPLRDALLESGIQQPSSNLDVQAWIGRLGDFPDESRPNAVKQIANSWSLTDPAGAIGWARGLQEGREEAFYGLAQGWAGADRWEASEWVAGLDEGADRDQAILGMIGEIVISEPSAAWEWARAVTSDEAREAAMVNTINAVAKKQADVASQMLEEAGLREEIAGGLHQEIERQRVRQQGS